MAKAHSPTLAKEALAFGKYFLGHKPNAQAVALYEAALAHSPQKLTRSELKLVQLGLRHRWLIGLIDSGLAVTNRTSPVRRRLYIMFAILESSPAYAAYFLPRKRSPFYLLVMAVVGVRSILKALIGGILVKVVR